MPDFWPVIPLIAVNRHPVFPKVNVSYVLTGWCWLLQVVLEHLSLYNFEFFDHRFFFIFPKFIKIIEISDERLMTILRRKVRLNQPYAGVFVKVDDDNDDEVVDDITELHDVGTFVQIMEMQDFGNRYV